MFFAVKEAILSARSDAGHDGNFRLDSPATPERVRMACEDQFTEMVSTYAFKPLYNMRSFCVAVVKSLAL